MTSFPLPATKWVLNTSRDPPVYTRPMVGSEFSMQKHWNAFDADGQVSIGLDFVSSIEVNELKRRARVALDKLRFLSPIIACTTEGVVSLQWVYTPSADREAWLDLALVVEERGASVNAPEFLQRINLARLPYTNENTTSIFRAYLLTSTTKRDDGNEVYGLYFHGPHSIIDAGPGLNALNLMLEWMSGAGPDVQIDSLNEWMNLAVDPITATGGPPKEWEASGGRLLQAFGEESARTAPCHTLVPPSLPANPTVPPFRYETVMTETESTAIVAATKKLGINISALFHAAHCLAQFKMNPLPETTTDVDFTSTAPVISLDRYFKPPVDPKTHFISAFTVMPLRFSMVQPLAERDERARLIAVSRIYQDRFDKYLLDPCLPSLLAVLEHISQPGDQTTEKAPSLPAYAWYCAFNNLGMLENKVRSQHDGITVEKLRISVRLRNVMYGSLRVFEVELMKFLDRTVHMWSMRSKFYFQIEGNTVWGEECVKTMLEETMRIALLVAS